MDTPSSLKAEAGRATTRLISQSIDSTASVRVKISECIASKSGGSHIPLEMKESTAPAVTTFLPVASGGSTTCFGASRPSNNYLRQPKPKVKSRGLTSRVRLNPVSKTRKAELAIYLVRVAAFKKEHPICCYCHTRKTTDNHHERGRLGPLLLDERYWRPCCRRCHDRQPGHANSAGPRHE